MKKILLVILLIYFSFSCINKNKILNAKKVSPILLDTLQLDCYMIDTIKPKIVSNKIYRINFENKAILKTIDSIIENERIDNTRKWLIVVNNTNYQLVQSLECYIFCIKEDLLNTYFIRRNNKFILVYLKDKAIKKYFIDKKFQLLLMHPQISDCDIPLDHPKTFTIDSTGSIIKQN